MSRLRTPPDLAKVARNFVLAVASAGIFFGVLHLAALNDSRDALQQALNARAAAAAEANPVQRAAREVCNDGPTRPDRILVPRWSHAGLLECEVVIAWEPVK